MIVSRLDEARALLGAIDDPGMAEFVRFGLTLLLRKGSNDADGNLDAVAFVAVLRVMYQDKATLQAVLRGDRSAYSWDE